jgi:hypothetical protein
MHTTLKGAFSETPCIDRHLPHRLCPHGRYGTVTDKIKSESSSQQSSQDGRRIPHRSVQYFASYTRWPLALVLFIKFVVSYHWSYMISILHFKLDVFPRLLNPLYRCAGNSGRFDTYLKQRSDSHHATVRNSHHRNLVVLNCDKKGVAAADHD